MKKEKIKFRYDLWLAIFLLLFLLILTFIAPYGLWSTYAKLDFTMNQLADSKCKLSNNYTNIFTESYDCYLECYRNGVININRTNIINETFECYNICDKQVEPIFMTGYYSNGRIYCLGKSNMNLGSCSNSGNDKNFILPNGLTCYNGETYDIIKVVS